MPGSPHARQPAREAPGAYPLLGHLIAYRRDPLAFFSSCADGPGSVTECRLGGRGYVLNDPADIRHVLVGNQGNYEKVRRLAGPHARWLRRRSLLTSSGTAHRRKRKMIQPLFRLPLIEMIAERSRSNAVELLAGWSEGDEIEIHEAMMSLARRNMLETLFDSPSEDLLEALAEGSGARRRFVQHFHFSAFPMPEYLPIRVNLDHLKGRRRVNAALAREIQARRRMSDAPQDLLTMLLEATAEDGSTMSDSEVRDEVITFSMTGFETVGEALTWTLYLLARHPEVDASVTAEARTAFDPEAPVTSRGPDLPYSRAVVQESLRLYPPTWVYGRLTVEEDTLPSGVTVQAGSKLYLCPFALHRDRRFWDEAERFDPERFLNGSGRAADRYAYFPFGGGRRVCIGEQVAMAEMLTVLATIVDRHRLTLSADQEATPAPDLTLNPRGGLSMRVERRD